MSKMSGSEIREMFLAFFEGKEHTRVHSSSLVPHNDPTLLFTNAGMNQFKDVFLGLEKRAYSRATTAQKCVRAGGKHNDLENVGFTRRHHTFFEMLGNFSFGDYFKKDAIAYAWELVTSKKWFGLDKDKLYITIFKGENGVARDSEAYQFWLDVGVPKERIFELGAKDNFWQMGDTGPCGPCSEIYYDMGQAASETPDKDLPFGEDDARYVEIWNLVFMQFDRSADGTLNPLPKPSIDTGAGLERLAAVLQGKLSNFETDLFTPLINRADELIRSGNISKNLIFALLADKYQAPLRIIADHARAATFLINDGVMPANEGPGYVLRKILRRGIRHGRLLGQEKPFMYQMVCAVRDLMQDAYPELKESADRVAKVIRAEEEQFARVIETGSRKLQIDFTELIKPDIDRNYLQLKVAAETRIGEDDFNRQYQKLISEPHNAWVSLFVVMLKSIVGESYEPIFSGAQAFHLYETYGLPLDFMVDAARDTGIAFDHAGFERARAEEQARARASWKGGSKATASPVYRELPKTLFEGYTQRTASDCEVLAIVKDGVGVQEVQPGDSAEIVLDHTPFYADSGGQVGDHGWLTSEDGNLTVADVHGCTKPVQGVFAHKVTVKQPIRLGDKLNAIVDNEFRTATMRNHTGTHLLQAALRETLGTHVKQAGSLNDPQHLRFDFSHFTQVADEELQDIESLINKNVLVNTRVETIEDVPIDVAVNEFHAMALFGEKYGDFVRVVKIGDFSTELCGGTHTAATGEIGLVKLISEGSVSSGVRRIEAITGTGALDEFRRGFAVTKLAEQIAGKTDATSPAAALQHKLATQEEELKRLRRELDDARMKSAAGRVKQAASQSVEVKGIKVLAQRVDALDRNQMRVLVDNLRNQIGSGVVILGGAQEEGKVALIVGVTKDLISRVQAGKIVGQLAQKVGGSGGGRPDMAEAGGKDASQLDAALSSASDIVSSLLG
ncbi:MAG TPA: alanine--tRNA ligase [Acidobacteriaceae bacterium]|jgi:alanyl-tRNA synthetase|nr:alanine--tRNA ligase [Acidobacteriaceae bacterium]